MRIGAFVKFLARAIAIYLQDGPSTVLPLIRWNEHRAGEPRALHEGSHEGRRRYETAQFALDKLGKTHRRTVFPEGSD